MTVPFDLSTALKHARDLALTRAGLSLMSGTGGFAPALSQAVDVGLGTYAQGAAQAQAQAQAQQRQQVLSLMQGQPGETPAEAFARLSPRVAEVMALGDPQLSKTFVEYVNHLGDLAEKGRPQVVTPGEQGAYVYDRATGTVQRIAPGAESKPAGKAEKVLGPDGKPYTVLYGRDGKVIAKFPEYVMPAEGVYTPAERRQVLGQFFQNTQDIRHRASLIGLANAAIQSAASGNWAAYASAISKYVQAVDQDKNLRQGMLEYFEKGLAPSVYQSTVKLLEKKAYGRLPREALELMAKHAADMASEYQDQYRRIRDEFKFLYPGVDFPKPDVYFGPPAVIKDSLRDGPLFNNDELTKVYGGK